MKIEHLRLFLDVVHYGSINKAAQKNYMIQQNLSKLIKTMEEETDKTLLKRTNQGITLTDDGKQFFEFAHNTVTSYDDFLNNTADDNKVINFYIPVTLYKGLSDLQNNLMNDEYYISLNERGSTEIKKMIMDKTEGVFFFAARGNDIDIMQQNSNAYLIEKEIKIVKFCHESNILAKMKKGNGYIDIETLNNFVCLQLLCNNEKSGYKKINISDVDTCKKLMVIKGYICALPSKVKKILGFDSDEWIVLDENSDTDVRYFLIIYEKNKYKRQIIKEYFFKNLKNKLNK